MASHDNLLREVGEPPRIIPVEIAEYEGALKRLVEMLGEVALERAQAGRRMTADEAVDYARGVRDLPVN